MSDVPWDLDARIEAALRAYDEELPLDQEPPDEDTIMRDSMRRALSAAGLPDLLARIAEAENAGPPEIALRDDDNGDLDDVVVKHVRMFRAEMMSDKELWMACYFDDKADERLTFWVRVKGGKLLFSTPETPSDYVDFDAPSGPRTESENQ